MGKDLRSTRKQILAWSKKKYRLFIAWIKPDKNDSRSVQILKSILKIPIIVFAIAVSPVVLIILGLIFFLVL